jgi:hypothetical protein
MKRSSRASFAAALGLALTACSYQPSMQHPTLPALVPIDTTMDCRQIDLAIDRADTVRWLIRDDGGSLETSSHRAARYTGNFVLVPLSVIGGGLPVMMTDGGHTVLNAADGRIRELLQLKREHACPPRATAVPELDDLALLGEIEAVQADFGAGRVDEEQMLTRRTKLLDNLRLIQPPGGTSPSDAPSNDRDQ